MDLSVVVAAYNEEAVIADSLTRVVEELRTRPDVRWELICVNDGSSDGTAAIVDEFTARCPQVIAIHHRRNFGQGRALQTGFAHCRGRVIVTLDADLSYGPEYIYELADQLEEERCEIALASPYTKGGEVQNVPMHRRFLSRFGNLYLARMLPYRSSTSTCVVRAYRKEVLESLVLTSDGMELQLEILMKAALMGFRVREVPARLQWAPAKAAAQGFRRASKMRILRTIWTYLLMGWVSRPAFALLKLSLLLILPGCYMAAVLLVRFAQAAVSHAEQGIALAASAGLEHVFRTHTYSLVFSAAFLVLGVQVFAFALLLIQNKFHFEQISIALQASMGNRALRRGDVAIARIVSGSSGSNSGDPEVPHDGPETRDRAA